ncbi:MAG: tetratricopeptide repeat protein [Prevotella sp.]|jgi:tetratricopeptide (TPR) repeat protein|nr:tetratricopeptide repeat protein [Prevotella sp.]
MKNIAFGNSYILCLLLIFFFYSCKKDNHSAELLTKAQSIAENKPSEALLLLDSISNPEQMDRNSYMQYIVTRVQAKFNIHRPDIKNDTLIFDAYKYLDEKKNYQQSALAHYYTAALYNENEFADKELEHFKLAAHYARKVDDSLLVGKSLHWIGILYFNKNMMDSAIVNFKQSLHYYPIYKDAEKYRLHALNLIGFSYEIAGKLDSALVYSEKGMVLAEKSDDKSNVFTFSHLMGVVYRELGDSQKSEFYLHKALSGTTNSNELRRICLSMLMLYNGMNRLDSARHYSDLLINYIPEMTYINTRQESYAAISEYYKKSGDYKTALYYNNLYDVTTQEIKEADNTKKLAEADRKYKAVIEQQELQSTRMRSYLYLIGAVSFTLIILMTICFRGRTSRLKRQRVAERNKLLEEQSQVHAKLLEHQHESLTYMQGIYRSIVDEWVDIDKKVKSLAKEFGVKEEPELYMKIKQMIENFKQNTNQQLVVLAKEHFLKQPYGDSAVSTLKDKDLLLFMLYYCGYKRNDVAILLGVNPHKDNMAFRKLDLRNKLLKIGMEQYDIEKILFSEENVN